MPTVVILYWDHPVSVVAESGLAIGRALSSLGADVRFLGVMDVNLNVKESVVSECLSDPAIANCDIVLSMGGPPLSIRVGDQWLFEILGKSFHMLSMDALFYDYTRVRGVAEFLNLARISSRLGILWVDRDACRVIGQLTAGPVYYMPPGGIFDPILRGERIKRIAVVASMGHELAQVSSESTFEDLVLDAPSGVGDRQSLLDFARAIQRPGPIEGVLNLAMETLGLSAEAVYTFEVARYLARLDAFEKRRRRRQAVEALSDVPIDFFGPGWEPYTAGFKDCRYMGEVPYVQMPKVCQQYGVILDFNPGFGHGLHDRVFVGVGNGARVMTNFCRAIPDLDLPDPDAIIPYVVGDPDLAEVAHRALALPPMEPESLLDFRAKNSVLARMDEWLLFLNSQ